MECRLWWWREGTEEVLWASALFGAGMNDEGVFVVVADNWPVTW